MEAMLCLMQRVTHIPAYTGGFSAHLKPSIVKEDKCVSKYSYQWQSNYKFIPLLGSYI